MDEDVFAPAQPDAGEEAQDVSMDHSDLHWHFLQCFGQPSAAETAPAADLLSALQFDGDGHFLATGDQGGRVVLLEQSSNTQSEQANESDDRGGWMLPMEYNYLTEFQAHTPDFDYLKSIEISEKINSISWLPGTGQCQMLLAANDKQAKLWKVYEKEVVNIGNYNHDPGLPTGSAARGGPDAAAGQVSSAADLKVPHILSSSRTSEAKCKREYNSSTHLYCIHSVSLCSDQATFMTADDLAVYIWDLERSDSSLRALDIRPPVPEEQDTLKVVTHAAFHPSDPNMLAYSTSRTVLSMADMRIKDVSGMHALELGPNREVNSTNGAFFAELVWAASTFTFAPDGLHVATRDYMRGSIWDVRQPKQALRTYDVHEHLGERLMDVYENESIFDRLGCAISPTGQHIALGSYCELCVFNQFSDTFTTLKSCGSPVVINDQARRPEQGVTNFNWKVENIAWHPTEPLIVATALNSLYTYCAPRATSSF